MPYDFSKPAKAIYMDR